MNEISNRSEDQGGSDTPFMYSMDLTSSLKN
ncbi:MAG: hypothetical protein RIS68_1532 [Bacteroidota bacterium]|jgi:hypothetical protein